MTRIADGTRDGRHAYTLAFAIGYENCTCCGAETPDPPQSVLDDLAAKRSTASTIWPHNDWKVPGWMNINEYGYICDRCTRSVMALLAGRKRGEAGSDASDLAIIEANVARALELANEGVLTAFPPPPDLVADWSSAYRHCHPSRPNATRYLTTADYRVGELRQRIFEIRDALQGKRTP